MTEPLHSLRLAPGQWWACSEPERPDDGQCVYDDRCQACRLKAAAELAVNGDVDAMNLEDGSISRLSDLAAGSLGD